MIHRAKYSHATSMINKTSMIFVVPSCCLTRLEEHLHLVFFFEFWLVKRHCDKPRELSIRQSDFDTPTANSESVKGSHVNPIEHIRNTGPRLLQFLSCLRPLRSSEKPPPVLSVTKCYVLDNAAFTAKTSQNSNRLFIQFPV